MANDFSMRHPLEQQALDRWQDRVRQDAKREDDPDQQTRQHRRRVDRSRWGNVAPQLVGRAAPNYRAVGALANMGFDKLPRSAQRNLKRAGKSIAGRTKSFAAGVRASYEKPLANLRSAQDLLKSRHAEVTRAGRDVGKLNRSVRQSPQPYWNEYFGRPIRQRLADARQAYQAQSAVVRSLARHPVVKLDRAVRSVRDGSVKAWQGVRDGSVKAWQGLKDAASRVKGAGSAGLSRYAAAHPTQAKVGHWFADPFKADRALGKGVRGLGKAAKWTATAPVKGSFKAGVWMANQPQKAAVLFGTGRAAAFARAALSPKAGAAGFALGRSIDAIKAYNDMNPGDISGLNEEHELGITTADGKRHRVEWKNPGWSDAIFSKKMLAGLARGSINAVGDFTLGAVGDNGWLYKTDPEWKWADGDYESYKEEQRKLSQLLEEGYNPVTGEALRDADTGEDLSASIAKQSREIARHLRDSRLEAIYERSFDPEYYRTHKDQVDAAFKEMQQSHIGSDAFDPDRSSLAPVGGATGRSFAQTTKPWEVDADGLRREVDRLRGKYQSKMSDAQDNVLNWDTWSKEHKGMLDAMFHGRSYTGQDYLDKVAASLSREHETRINRLMSSRAAQDVIRQNRDSAYNLAVGGSADYAEDFRADLSDAKDFNDAWSQMSDVERLSWDPRDYPTVDENDEESW